MHVIANCEQLKTKICDMYAEHQNAIRTGSAKTVRVYVVIMRDGDKIIGDIQACRLDDAAPEVSDDQVPIWCDMWFTDPEQYNPDILYVDDSLEDILELIDHLLKNGGFENGKSEY